MICINYENFSSVVYDSAARVLSLVISDFDCYINFEPQTKNFIVYLLNNCFKSSKKVSDVMLNICLSYLLVTPIGIETFAENKGQYM